MQAVLEIISSEIVCFLSWEEWARCCRLSRRERDLPMPSSSPLKIAPNSQVTQRLLKALLTTKSLTVADADIFPKLPRGVTLDNTRYLHVGPKCCVDVLPDHLTKIEVPCLEILRIPLCPCVYMQQMKKLCSYIKCHPTLRTVYLEYDNTTSPSSTYPWPAICDYTVRSWRKLVPEKVTIIPVMATTGPGK